jgi:hypothetical protein
MKGDGGRRAADGGNRPEGEVEVEGPARREAMAASTEREQTRMIEGRRYFSSCVDKDEGRADVMWDPRVILCQEAQNHLWWR